jgi:UDP:flavonoid glycosyltransferase YjiC (YdhE family)
LFARVNRVMLEGTRQCARAWRPDVIIYGSLEAAGAIVAAEFGIPGVEHAVSPASATGVMVSALWTRVVDSDPVSAVAGIGVVPESLAPAPSPGWAMRTVPYNGGAVISDSLLSPIRRPRVLVTMGTVAPLAGGRGIVKALVEAAAEESAEVLVALGSDPAALGPLPPSVHACKWLPLTAALPGCSAVIHHGGAGTTLSALTFGVPQVVVPQGADQYLNAALVDRRGCAIQTEATPTKLRSAIRRALAGELDTASDDVRREIDRLPAPSDVASELVSLLASR